ncbi:MAG: DUF6188 family protein [Acidimicrobiales bacterium]
MTSVELTETPDRFVLRLADQEVTRCSVDFALTLVVGAAGNSLYLTMEQPFWFRPDEHSEEERFAPETEPERLGPVLLLLHRSVDEIVAQKDGLLVLRFAPSGAMTVPPSEEFEAWNIVGPDGLRIVAMPGGQLAVWKPRGA